MLGSESDLSTILDNVADGVTVQDRSGRMVYANTAAARVLGFETQAELVATSPTEVLRRFEMFDEAGNAFPPDQLPGRRVLAGEPEATVTLRFRATPTGEERWSSVRASSVTGEDGQVAYAVNVWHDVTAQKRTEFRQAFLAQAGELLASSLDIEATPGEHRPAGRAWTGRLVRGASGPRGWRSRTPCGHARRSGAGRLGAATAGALPAQPQCLHRRAQCHPDEAFGADPVGHRRDAVSGGA